MVGSYFSTKMPCTNCTVCKHNIHQRLVIWTNEWIKKIYIHIYLFTLQLEAEWMNACMNVRMKGDYATEQGKQIDVFQIEPSWNIAKFQLYCLPTDKGFMYHWVINSQESYIFVTDAKQGNYMSSWQQFANGMFFHIIIIITSILVNTTSQYYNMCMIACRAV